MVGDSVSQYIKLLDLKPYLVIFTFKCFKKECIIPCIINKLNRVARKLYGIIALIYDVTRTFK